MKRSIKSPKKRILFLGNSYLTVFGFRMELVEEYILQGYDVWVAFPNGPFGEGEETAKELGCHFVETKIDRRGENIIRDIALVFQYYKLLSTVKPDVVLAFTVKPDVYAGIICRLMNIPFFPNITGLGKGLTEKKKTKRILIMLYRFALKKVPVVFFQNEHDKAFFAENKMLKTTGIILPGSGVNLQVFQPLPYPCEDATIKFIYIARVMKTKGIEQYLEAASYLKAMYSEVEFHICGYCEENYKIMIEEKVRCGEIIYHGLVSDIAAYQKQSHCVVLPSFHPEGISNVLLESAACARPIITTNRVGCKEAVLDGQSGYLVEEKDSQDLIEKMIMFLNLSYQEKEKMGLDGRTYIETKFDRKKVVDAYMGCLEKNEMVTI